MLRLQALWAMRKTASFMQRLCAEILAMEPFGSRIRAQQDITGASEQPALGRHTRELARKQRNRSHVRNDGQCRFPARLTSGKLPALLALLV